MNPSRTLSRQQQPQSQPEVNLAVPRKTTMASSSALAEGPSPTQLAFAVAHPIASLAKIASDHGLSHDSGVSFNSTSLPKAKRPKKGMSLQQTVSTSLAVPHGETIGSAPEPSTSSSSGSSSLDVTAIDEGASTTKMVSESPGTTAAFDARDDTWADVARHVKPFGDTLRHGEPFFSELRWSL